MRRRACSFDNPDFQPKLSVLAPSPSHLSPRNGGAVALFLVLRGPLSMNSATRCQECNSVIKLDKTAGGRRARSVRLCEQCTEQYEKLEAAERRRGIVLAIATISVLSA